MSDQRQPIATIPAELHRLFNKPDHRLELGDKEILLNQGEPNHRLFLVVTGQLVSEGSNTQEDHIEAEAGDLLGIRSFFESDHLTRRTIRSVGTSTVAWIDEVPVVPAKPQKVS